MFARTPENTRGDNLDLESFEIFMLSQLIKIIIAVKAYCYFRAYSFNFNDKEMFQINN
jgi:hypothetical protein